METENYTPYGEEWKNELLKLPKIHIISLYRMVCLALKESEEEVNQLKIILSQAFPEKGKEGNETSLRRNQREEKEKESQ